MVVLIWEREQEEGNGDERLVSFWIENLNSCCWYLLIWRSQEVSLGSVNFENTKKYLLEKKGIQLDYGSNSHRPS